jgi:hypothetical protein
MPISPKYKIIFIHIPKCGGTTVESLLDIDFYEKNVEQFYTEQFSSNIYNKVDFKNFTNIEYRNCLSKNLQHYTYRELNKCLPETTLKEYKKIALVRNPFERLVSEYNYNHYSWEDFETFVNDRLSLDFTTRNWLYDGHLETQTSYLLNECDSLSSIDKIFKLENSKEWFDFFKLITQKQENYWCRKSLAKKPLYEYYNESLIQKVIEFYREDFINFNYSFNLPRRVMEVVQ